MREAAQAASVLSRLPPAARGRVLSFTPGVLAGRAFSPGAPLGPPGPETQPRGDGHEHAEHRLHAGVSDALGDLLAEDVADSPSYRAMKKEPETSAPSTNATSRTRKIPDT